MSFEEDKGLCSNQTDDNVNGNNESIKETPFDVTGAKMVSQNFSYF